MKTNEQVIMELVAEQTGKPVAELKRETRLGADLELDSLDCVELVMELEDEFDISIPDEAAEKIETIGQAIDYVEGNLPPDKSTEI